MRTLVVAILLAFVFIPPVRAQADSNRIACYEYVVGASLAYSLFDYVGYNLANRTSFLPTYRILEGTVQAAISYFLYKQCGLSSAIAFNLIWWTWNDDLLYYGWADLFNLPSDALPTSDWENRSNSGLLDRSPYWAWWTPIGLLRPKYAPIARSALIAQAVVGFSVSMAILW